MLGACSSSEFTADGAGGGGSAGQASTSGSTNGGGQAGESESNAGAGTAEGGAAGADLGEGGSPSGGNPEGGNPGGGNPNAGGPSGGAVNAGGPNGGGAGQPALKAFDDFVESAQGWTVTGDVSTVKPALYSSTGGNPNGSIYWTDGGGSFWYFDAPAKYLGDDSAFYGGVLRFDLKVTAITTLRETSDVELTSDALTLAYDCTPDPTTTYTRYTVTLKETKWKVGTLSGAAATAAQFKQVLAKLTRLRIRGEFNEGTDTGHLDNVYLGMP